MKYFHLLALSYAVCLSGFGSDQRYKINLNGYPKTHRECQAAANSVAQKFASETGATILLARCERNRALSYDIEIQYSAENILKLAINPAWPVYESFEKCQNNLAFEETSFKALTGIAPFMRYCSDYEISNGWEKGAHRYSPFFYAIGNSKLKSKTFSLHMYEGVNKNPGRVVSEIIWKTKSAGLPIVDAFLDLRKGDSELWLKFVMDATAPESNLKRRFLLKENVESFYLPNFLALDADPMLSDSLDSCEVQRVKATKLFESAFSSPVVWYCMWDSNVFRARLYHLRINVGEESFEKFEPGEDGEPFSNDYATHAECEIEMPRVVGHYKKKLGDRLTGGLCSWEYKYESHVRVKMFMYATGQ